MDYKNFRAVKGTRLYRSSKPDCMRESDVQKLTGLGIKTIIDLRSPLEVNGTSGALPVDHFYKPISVEAKLGSEIKYRDLTGQTTDADTQYFGNHYFFDILNKDYERTMFRRSAWYIQLICLLLMIRDYLCKGLSARKFLLVLMIRQRGVAGQYLDFVETCGAELVRAIQTLCNSDRVPALIVCAYGKDRTGIMSAIVMSLCGMSREDIVLDYSVSEKELGQDLNHVKPWAPEIAMSNPQYMMDVLDFIDNKYGSVSDYLEFFGLDKKLQKQLVENIQER